MSAGPEGPALLARPLRPGEEEHAGEQDQRDHRDPHVERGVAFGAREKHYRRLVIPLAQIVFGMALVAVSVTWQQLIAAHNIHGTPFSDWQHYAMSWNRVMLGGDLYHADQLAGPFGFPAMLFIGWAYPPAAVTLWAPFASWPWGYIAWTMVNVGLLLTALWAVATRTWPERRAAVFALMLVALSQFAPFVEAAALGNPDLALAGLLVWVWVGGPRTAVIAGVLGGLVKVAPVAFLLYARRWGWRWTVIGIGALAAIAIVTLPLVGLSSYEEYASTLQLAVAPCAPLTDDNVAIACHFPVEDRRAGRTIGLLLAAAMALGAGLVPNRLIAFSLAAMAYPIANHDLRGHTWMPVVAVAIACATELAGPRPRPDFRNITRPDRGGPGLTSFRPGHGAAGDRGRSVAHRDTRSVLGHPG